MSLFLVLPLVSLPCLPHVSDFLVLLRVSLPCPPTCPVHLQAVAGLLADARSLADVAKEEASSFRSNYGYDIPLKVSVAELLRVHVDAGASPLTECVSSCSTWQTGWPCTCTPTRCTAPSDRLAAGEVPPERDAFRDQPHRCESSGGGTRGGMMTDNGFAHWTELQ